MASVPFFLALEFLCALCVKAFSGFADLNFDYASESDSSKPVVGSGNSPDSRITPQSRHSTYSASESLAMSCVRGWRQEAGSFTRLLLSCPNHNTRNGM